ncbi:hypothetical protein LTR53_000390 [Teratosphaeriaceae sp. CCFEE 6253]|nr:hypothetical protein LTR53_000390 [Teratosphaeriaceae sp. CCFEE 6253]
MPVEKPDYDYPGPPLPTSRSIRVVLLQPAARLEDEVRCSFKIASLDECGPGREDMPYEALSYAWGERPDTHAIFLNDSPQPVRSNLFVALRRLCLRNRVRRLWVNALCINQQDPAERASQVAQMADTFRRASQVLIWVGEDSAACDGAATFAFVRKVRDATRSVFRQAREGIEQTAAQYRTMDRICEKTSGQPSGRSSDDGLRGEHSPALLQAFLSRTWFTRRGLPQHP